MVLHCSTIHQDVIEEDNDELPEIRPEEQVHGGLEG